jgi:hypothetical protein
MKLRFLAAILLTAAFSAHAANATAKTVTLVGSSTASCAPNGLVYFNLTGELDGTAPRNFFFPADHVLSKVWLSKLESALATGSKITASYSTSAESCIVYGFRISEMQITP